MMRPILIAALFLLTCVSAEAATLRDKYDAERHIALDENKVASYLQKNTSWTAKDGYKPSLTFCTVSSQACETTQAETIVSAKFAYRGDYQAQRNLAYCLNYGCNGAIVVDKTLSCAWRIVIVASATAEVDATDTGNLQNCMKDLTPLEHAASVSRAAKLYKSVYGRAIGREWR